MITRKIMMIFLLSMSLHAHADNELKIASNIGLMIDWAQTREIATNNNYLETNPVLGARPTIGDVNRYFVAAIFLNNIIGEMLPERYATMWYGGITIMQVSAVSHNYSIGIGMRF